MLGVALRLHIHVVRHDVFYVLNSAEVLWVLMYYLWRMLDNFGLSRPLSL